MAKRMQQRRGTAAQWISLNDGDGPILNVGEIGFETDTGKFKIGDGQNPWVDLDYFLDESEINSITGDYVLTSTLGQANGVATLDGNAKLTASQIPNIEELAQDAVDMALIAGTGITKTYNDNANTITVAVDTSVIATKAELAEVSQDSVNDAIIAGTGLDKTYNDNQNTITLDIDSTVVTLDGSQTLTNKTITAPSGLVKGDVGLGNVDNTSDADKPVSTATQSALDLKAPLASPTFTGTVSGVTASMVGLGNVDNTSDANKPVSTATQSALDAKLALSGGTMTGDITLVGSPTQALHAATKAYVDGIAEGLHIHASVVAATTGNIAIATELEPGDIVDGVTLAEGDRVLVKSQTNAAQNGIYVVQASGAALRAADFNEPQEVDGGDFVFVTGGTTHDNTGWVQTTTNVVTVGTDPIQFTQFSGAGTYLAGTGLQINDNIFSIDTTATVDISTAQTLTNKTLTSPNINGATIGGDLVPSADSAYDLGSSTNKFKDLYLAGTTLYLDTATIELHSGNIALGHSGNTTTVPIGGGNHTVATLAGEQTLTNKTIDAASNTISNIPNASLDNSDVTINGESVSLGGTITIPTGATAQAVSSNISLQHNYNYFVDTSAARTLTLSATPSLGDTIAIIDSVGSASTNKITVSSNGGKINGTVQDLEIDVNNAAAVLLYTGSTYGWRVG